MNSVDKTLNDVLTDLEEFFGWRVNTQHSANLLDNYFTEFVHCLSYGFDTIPNTVYQTFDNVFRNVIRVFDTCEPVFYTCREFLDTGNDLLNDFCEIKSAVYPVSKLNRSITDVCSQIENIHIQHRKYLFKDVKSNF